MEKKIAESLNYLDDNINVITPGMGRFKMMVEQVELKKEARANKQFLTFVFAALFGICLETFAFSRSLFTFIAVQAAAIVLLPLLTVFLTKLKPGWVKLH